MALDNNDKQWIAETIAQLLKESETRTDKKFKKVDERFDQVNEKFVQIDERFDQLSNEVKEVKSDVDQLSNEMKQIKSDVDQLTVNTAEGFNEVSAKFEIIDNKIDKLSSRLNAKIDKLSKAFTVDKLDLIERNEARERITDNHLSALIEAQKDLKARVTKLEKAAA